MADAAVQFLLDNLQQLLIYHTHLIADAKNQVEKLESDLRLINAFLKASTKKRRKDVILRQLVREIRDVVYEAEDIIDAFVTQAAESQAKNYFLRAFQTRVKLDSITTQVEKVCATVKEIYGDESRIDFAALNVGDGGAEKSEAPVVRQENVVGFEDEAEKLIGYLTEETQQLDVISIIGMPGLGKTTLAGKIFRDPAIQYEFPTRIWVYVSQEFTRKDIFLAILREFTRPDEEMYQKNDQELARLVASYLERGKFLIVMDDVWTAEDWDKLQIALPKSNKMGKVLITSRHVEVGQHANINRHPHKLRFLTEEESWLLLRLEVFGEPECPPELEGLGKLITEQCDRLPLAIVAIGGILCEKYSALDDMTAKQNAWTKVSTSVSTYLNEDPARRMENIIALSYDKLPYHLRACFLYLGMFPEDYEIPVWKLIRMWIAEGFIQEKSGISLEETAENYLEDLINRNLVRVDKRRPDGRVKTCRIHDMLRDFCRNEAGSERENFLQEIKRSSNGFEPSISQVQKFRRLCIHSNILHFFSSKPYGPRARSFVCFSKEEVGLPSEYTSAIPTAFKLLRVLEVQPIKFTKIPSDIYQLIHLRYLTISFSLAVLPPAFSKLWNMQTLVVETTSRTLEIKADIWKMIQLRHLKTNASTTLPKVKSSKEGEKLRTLGTIAPQSCTDEVFERARNLKKLGIRGRLALLIDGKSGSFDSLGKLENLEKLKLLNDVFPSPPSEGQLRGLPPPYKFPKKLKSLTLADTFLDWSNMSILGLLENLEVLKLKDKSFMGKCWEAADGGFRRLEVLHIGRTDLVFWIASAHHFPRLRRLELQNCEELKEVPIGLADIENFQILDLYRTKFASASAKKIGEAKKKQGQTGKAGGFKLSIFPIDE
ncbi:putative late blight resistance protein homolog R1A-10 [Sesamum indicum]|uniref:Late blight resistance protein homolog R1A-10 n=1 Tax=Sesamum indicum TaxID=4182 RepID=A0A6I9SPM9_SESIN|nr:putative late blight resistance protein homolog R1A-10 [Sesamum indicum]